MTLHPEADIKPIFDLEKEQRPMNVVAFMSGSGTNVEKILEFQMALQEKHGVSPYHVVAIFSDTTLRKPGEKKGSRAQIIADEWNKEHGDNVECLFWQDIDEWYQQEGRYEDKRAKGESREKKVELRTSYDNKTLDELKQFEKRAGNKIDAIALAGYMSFLTAPILDYALCVNVHPADLTLTAKDPKTGKTIRKYTGDHAVRDAILAGETTIASSTHRAEERVDYGKLFMISEPLNVITSFPAENINPNRLTLKQLVDDAPERLQEVVDFNQDKLKEKGDWIIFPKTLEYIARGMFGKDEKRNVYHKDEKGKWEPGEIRLG